MLENAIEGMELTASRGPTLSGKPLFVLAKRMKLAREILGKIDRRCDARVVAGLVRASGLGRDELRQPERVKEAAKLLGDYMQARYPDLCPIQVDISTEVEHGAGRIGGEHAARARARVSASSTGSWSTPPNTKSCSPSKKTSAPSATRRTPSNRRAAHQVTIADAEKLAEFIDERGRRGITLSRYKGLGEMNAEELWATTMDPDARTLLQVKDEDSTGRTDELFSF